MTGGMRDGGREGDTGDLAGGGGDEGRRAEGEKERMRELREI